MINATNFVRILANCSRMFHNFDCIQSSVRSTPLGQSKKVITVLGHLKIYHRALGFVLLGILESRLSPRLCVACPTGKTKTQVPVRKKRSKTPDKKTSKFHKLHVPMCKQLCLFHLSHNCA